MTWRATGITKAAKKSEESAALQDATDISRSCSEERTGPWKARHLNNMLPKTTDVLADTCATCLLNSSEQTRTSTQSNIRSPQSYTSVTHAPHTNTRTRGCVHVLSVVPSLAEDGGGSLWVGCRKVKVGPERHQLGSNTTLPPSPT